MIKDFVTMWTTVNSIYIERNTVVTVDIGSHDLYR